VAARRTNLEDLGVALGFALVMRAHNQAVTGGRCLVFVS
jgi:hypothetical protein